MAVESKIEWCDSTFNPWIGCTKISPACDHCYASVSTATRHLGVQWGAGKPRHHTSDANWKLPRLWNNRQFYQCVSCMARGEAPPAHKLKCWRCGDQLIPARRRVFCSSLADVFDNEVDPQWRHDLFMLISETPNLDWLLLTKRIGNVKDMAPAPWLGGPIQHGPDPTNIHGGWPENVWLGITICNQQEADRDIPKLTALPAPIKFLSMEPLLESVDLRMMGYAPLWAGDGPGADCRASSRLGISWVIVGGESGQGARPMRPSWVRSLRDQCAVAGVPFLFKQWGEWVPALSGMWFHSLSGMPQFEPRAAGRDTHDFGHGLGAVRVGKKVAGRMFDGKEYNGYPEVRHGQ